MNNTMLDATKTAILFPGQGSQTVGMGKAFVDAFSVAKATLEEANSILGFDLSSMCFDGPQEILSDTANAQPALYAVGVAALRSLNDALGVDGGTASFTPQFVAGHSLGEFTALTAANVLSFSDGLKLVRKRGELMRDAGSDSPGGMVALLGPSVEKAEELALAAVDATGEALVVANDNCPGQVVLSGGQTAVTYAADNASEYGAKKAVALNVSVATHSPLMQPAAEAFNAALEATPMNPPTLKVVGNTTASALVDVAAIQQELRNQLTSRVRWTGSIQYMIDNGVNTFIELGTGNVLSKLNKRIDRGVTSYTVEDPDGISKIASLFNS